jgi:hypothetical protein
MHKVVSLTIFYYSSLCPRLGQLGRARLSSCFITTIISCSVIKSVTAQKQRERIVTSCGFPLYKGFSAETRQVWTFFRSMNKVSNTPLRRVAAHTFINWKRDVFLEHPYILFILQLSSYYPFIYTFIFQTAYFLEAVLEFRHLHHACYKSCSFQPSWFVHFNNS